MHYATAGWVLRGAVATGQGDGVALGGGPWASSASAATAPLAVLVDCARPEHDTPDSTLFTAGLRQRTYASLFSLHALTLLPWEPVFTNDLFVMEKDREASQTYVELLARLRRAGA